MNKLKLLFALLIFALIVTVISCSVPTIKTTTSWVNKDKIPLPQPINSVFIIALTDNREVRINLENEVAAAAQKKGITTYKSVEVIGPVDLKMIAPVKDVFLKKLDDLKCESIFTIALIRSTSETYYTQGTGAYSPYSYGAYGGYGGYGPYSPYGGFGGYYGFTVSTMSSPGYYTTDKKYFIEAKLFDKKSDTLLLSIQSKASNLKGIEASSKLYTEELMKELKKLGMKREDIK